MGIGIMIEIEKSVAGILIMCFMCYLVIHTRIHIFISSAKNFAEISEKEVGTREEDRERREHEINEL